MSDKLQRTLGRFHSKVAARDFYEAHQTLRTITNRYVKLKQYAEAANLLYEGATTFAKNGEGASAADLLLYLLQVYAESGTACEGTDKSRVLEVVQLLPNQEPLGDLAKQALNWSTAKAGKFGDAQLHHVFGVKMLNAVPLLPETDKYGVFAMAEMHLILGTHESLAPYLDFLYKWFEKSQGDAGTFVGRAALNYAYLKNTQSVDAAVAYFTLRLEGEEAEGYKYYEAMPLLNFFQLFAETLKKNDAGDKFMRLLNQYRDELTTAEFLAPVEYIGRVYFGLQIGAKGGNNMLANLMGGLFK